MKTSLILALIASILGMLFGMGLMALGAIAANNTALGGSVLLLSIIGLLLAAYDFGNNKLFGLVLIVDGILIFFTSLVSILPGILFVVSGITLRKEEVRHRRHDEQSQTFMAVAILLLIIIVFIAGISSLGKKSATAAQGPSGVFTLGGPAKCGDGRCQSNESCTSCPSDCGECKSIKYIDASSAHLENFDSEVGFDGVELSVYVYDTNDTMMYASGRLSAVIDVECGLFDPKTKYQIKLQDATVEEADFGIFPLLTKGMYFENLPTINDSLCSGELTATLHTSSGNYSDKTDIYVRDLQKG